MFDTTILEKKIDGLKEAYQNGNFGDALIAALNTGNGLMQQRIFGDNTDIAGNTFGKYIGIKKKQTDRSQVRALFSTKSKTDKKRIKSSAGQSLTPYERKRALKGRQVAKKDLEFTGGLRRAIETKIEDEKAATLNFNNDEAAMIAKGQEAQITNIRNGRPGTTKGTGIKIFTLNESEKEQTVDQGKELILEILKPNK